MAKFKGQFDQGWDTYREETFQRQLKLGVIPPRHQADAAAAGNSRVGISDADQKKVAARLMEVFAAFTAQTDHEVGRVIDALDAIGQRDNTLILWEIGDNGASMEGTLNGVFNEMASLNGMKEDTSYILEHIDEIGGPKSYNHFPVGWAWAMNTPFQWGKQVASHFGGTRNPLVVSWPARIKDKGAFGTQFHHVIDVVPTMLEAAGVPEPVEVNGVWQKPIEGVSMVYSFDDPKAKGIAEPSTSRCSATGRSITTAGSRSAAMAGCRGRTRVPTTSPTTSGSSTTSTKISAKPMTSRRRTHRS